MDQDRTSTDRKSLWAAIVGGVGVVVAIVALVFAISAKNATNDDVQVTDAVKQEATAAVSGVRGELDRDVRAADEVLVRLRASAVRAKRTRATLKREADANRSGVAVNRGDIQRLQTSVDTLTGDVADITRSVDALADDQRTLAQRVRMLEREVAADEGAVPADEDER